MTTHNHLAPKLGMRRATPLLHLCAILGSSQGYASSPSPSPAPSSPPSPSSYPFFLFTDDAAGW